MSDPRVFISFDFDHNQNEKMLFAGQSKHSKTPFSIQDWSSKEALEENEWREIIKAKINKCNLVVVLVGRNMSSANGVYQEIKMAKEQNVPVFGVYVDTANYQSNLPENLARRRVIPWSWEGIANAIDQMMTEGKNRE